MTCKFVVRWMTEDDRLLAWAQVWGESSPSEARGSCPFYARPSLTRARVEASGTIAKVVVHWAELNAVRSRLEPPVAVHEGQTIEYVWIEPIWMVQSQRGIALPSVTVSTPQVLSPDTVVLGAKDSR